MRKILFLYLTSLLIINTLQAQRYEYNDEGQTIAPQRTPERRHKEPGTLDVNRIRFGLFLAPTISWMHPTSSKSDDGNYFVNGAGSRMGFTWGLLADYYFAPNYGITLGLDINNTGGKIDTRINPDKASTTAANTVLKTHFEYKTQFVEIPFALKLRSDELGGSGIRVFGQIGITLGVNISRKVSYDVTYIDNDGSEKTVSSSNEKLQGSLALPPVNLQLNLGAGIEYPITDKMSFYTGLFFNNGFLPDATNPANYSLDYTGSFEDGNIRQNNIALRLGVFF